MDETVKSVLLLIIGAAISFLPQEASRYLQSQRDINREKRLIEQQRREKLWQLELERLNRIEALIGRITARQTEAERSDEEKRILAQELFYLRTVLLRYPDIAQAFNHYLGVALRQSQARINEESKDVTSTLEAEKNEAIRWLFAVFDEHLSNFDAQKL